MKKNIIVLLPVLILALIVFIYVLPLPVRDNVQPEEKHSQENLSGKDDNVSPSSADVFIHSNLTQKTNGNETLISPPTAVIYPQQDKKTETKQTGETVHVKPKRSWKRNFLASLGCPVKGSSIRFELVEGRTASGSINYVDIRKGELIYVSGALTYPAKGRFFFQKQTMSGKAGDFAGVVEFPSLRKGYRIDPDQATGEPELVEYPLDDLICMQMPEISKEALLTMQSEEIPPLNPEDVPDLVPAYNDGIISLQSLPGSTAVLYMDYRGGYTPTWGGISYEKPDVSNAQIKDVWKRVAEDYMEFNINVTTDIQVYEAAPENSRQRVAVTPTTTAAPGAGGVAYMNSWNWTGDTPCWSFYSSGKAAAEVISHESGHTLTLGHDGRTDPDEGYFGGQGSGETGWAPIMGVGYYKPVVQWSKGEYLNANNAEDDLYKITENNNSVDFRSDDTGNALVTARYMEIDSGGNAFAEGVIESTGDTDAFRFSTSGGTISLTASPVGDWANLAVMITVADSSDNVIFTSNPQSTMAASINTTLASGTYTLRITGAGRNDPLTDGFSNYASLGYYSVSGTIANGRASTYLSVNEYSPDGTLVGTIPPLVETGNSLIYTIESGNTSNAFAINNNGELSIANSSVIDYEPLAANTQFPVQFELFVTIEDTTNPLLTETGRRVVVEVIDGNETPTASGFDVTILSLMQIDTTLGTVTAGDDDAGSILTYSIISGNDSGLFAINSQGTITTAADITDTEQTLHSLNVRVTDNGSPSLSADTTVNITVIPHSTGLHPGSIAYAVYDNTGNSVYLSQLLTHPRFPVDPDWEIQQTLFEGMIDRSSDFGAVLRGYLIPPESGNYTFWFASDDYGELLLGSGMNTSTVQRIAYVDGWTNSREWDKYGSQQSASISLAAGQAYYIEARMKESGGGDNIAVAWSGPASSGQREVIPGLYLAPYHMNYIPHPSGFNRTVHRNLQKGSKIGSVIFSDQNPGDVATSFQITGGNGGGIFSIDNNGLLRVADETELLNAASPVNLTIAATDSGTPALSGTASVEITLVASEAITTTLPHREIFYDIVGNYISNMTDNYKYPNRPDEIYELNTLDAPVDYAEFYGSRIRAYLHPPESGDYQFFIASDDYSQLWFSSDTNPDNATKICYLDGWCGHNDWTANSSQSSDLQTGLIAGQPYYIEILHKEGVVGDHVSVAWAGPGINGTEIIDSSCLTVVDINYAPEVANHSFSAVYSDPPGSYVGKVEALDSPLDTLCWKISSGNYGNIFQIDPDTGEIFIASTTLLRNAGRNDYNLQVTVQDSGYGGLYPPHSSNAEVLISVDGPVRGSLLMVK